MKEKRRFAGIEPLESRRLLSAQLVRDISPATAGLQYSYKADLNGHDAILWTNKGIYASDGSASGTKLIHTSLLDLDGTANPPTFTRVGSTVYFVARESFSGPRGLWKTDGTAQGTVKLSVTATTFGSLTNCNGTLYFGALNGTRTQIWKSDGTDAGTILVTELTKGQYASSGPSALTWYKGQMYFAVLAAEGSGLWTTNGSLAGTTLIKQMGGTYDTSPFTGSIAVANNLMFFGASNDSTGNEPWRSDGTPAGTFLLSDIVWNGSSWPSSFISMPAGVVFVANDHLYRTDGTTQDTTAFYTNPAYGLEGLTRLGNVIYFKAHEYTTGSQLYRTDGTTAGTYKVLNINSTSAYLNSLTSAGNQLFFTANDGTHGGELWLSDGTAAGTRKINDGPGSTALIDLVGVGNRVFFTAPDALHGSETFVSDGTTIALVADIETAPTSSYPGGPFPATASNINSLCSATVGNITFFEASAALWKTDGTEAGTVRVADLPSVGSGTTQLQFLTAWNGAVYYTVPKSTGTGIYRSDGSTAGTVLLTTVDFTVSGGSPFVPFVGALYFFASTGLYKTDGTPAGTVNVTGTMDLWAAGWLTAAGNRLYFKAGYDTELYVSDGTAAGTKLLKDIAPGNTSSSPSELVAMGNTVYFIAQDSNDTATRGLWKTDGTSARTVPVARGLMGGYDPYGKSFLTVAGSLLYFAGYSEAGGTEMWKSDGTPAGTSMLKDISAGAYSSYPQWITPAGNRLYFTAYTPGTGRELWMTDGTPNGTILLRDLNAGASDGIPNTTGISSRMADSPLLADGANGAYFVGDNGSTGLEIWHTSGSPSSTLIVGDIYAGATSGNPHLMTMINSAEQPAVLFASDSADYGRELWSAATISPVWLDPSPDAEFSLVEPDFSMLAGRATLKQSHSFRSLSLSGSGAISLDHDVSMRVGALAIAATAQLDLTDGKLIIDYDTASPIGNWVNPSYSGIAGLVSSGRAGGAWNGSGLTSSSASGNFTTLGLTEASQALGISGTQTALFAGQTVDSTTVLVKCTYGGDANLDGKINVDDYTRIDFNVSLGSSGWYNGDFNYDGKINVDDYTIIDFNVGIQGPPLSNAVASAQSRAVSLPAAMAALAPLEHSNVIDLIAPDAIALV